MHALDLRDVVCTKQYCMERRVTSASPNKYNISHRVLGCVPKGTCSWMSRAIFESRLGEICRYTTIAWKSNNIEYSAA